MKLYAKLTERLRKFRDRLKKRRTRLELITELRAKIESKALIISYETGELINRVGTEWSPLDPSQPRAAQIRKIHECEGMLVYSFKCKEGYTMNWHNHSQQRYKTEVIVLASGFMLHFTKAGEKHSRKIPAGWPSIVPAMEDHYFKALTQVEGTLFFSKPLYPTSRTVEQQEVVVKPN